MNRLSPHRETTQANHGGMPLLKTGVDRSNASQRPRPETTLFPCVSVRNSRRPICRWSTRRSIRRSRAPPDRQARRRPSAAGPWKLTRSSNRRPRRAAAAMRTSAPAVFANRPDKTLRVNVWGAEIAERLRHRSPSPRPCPKRPWWSQSESPPALRPGKWPSHPGRNHCRSRPWKSFPPRIAFQRREAYLAIANSVGHVVDPARLHRLRRTFPFAAFGSRLRWGILQWGVRSPLGLALKTRLRSFHNSAASPRAAVRRGAERGSFRRRTVCGRSISGEHWGAWREPPRRVSRLWPPV